MRKKLSFIIVFAMLLSTVAMFAGCTKGGVAIDNTKTQLYISNYDGGQGTTWLYDKNSIDTLVGRFEEAYKNVSFEEGKMGVQVHVKATKEKGSSILSSMSALTEEIFFSEDIPYYSQASQGKFLDITDVIADVTDSAKNPGVSIDSTRLEGLSVNGKYYALPHYEIYDGLVYDKTLFENENLYFSNVMSNDGMHKFVESEDETRSPGPDAKMGTSDDGLPMTVGEFYKLCDEMVDKNITPMVWSGEHAFNFSHAFHVFYANALSRDELLANYSFDSNGTATKVITGFNGSTPVIEEVVITEENGYLVRQQAAKYYALEFLHKLYTTEAWYYADSVKNSVFSSKMAQEVFVRNVFEGGTTKPIGMLFDGNWWYNEASSVIQETKDNYGAQAANREFGYMTIPTAQTMAEANEGIEMKLVNNYNSYAFIKANIAPEKIECAKEFLRFAYTEKNLQQYTLDTGLSKAVDYSMTDAQLAQLPTFASDLIAYKMEHGSIDTRSTSTIYLKYFEADIKEASEIKGIGSFDWIPNAFKNSKVTPANYFTGMWISQSDWQNKYNK